MNDIQFVYELLKYYIGYKRTICLNKLSPPVDALHEWFLIEPDYTELGL